MNLLRHSTLMALFATVLFVASSATAAMGPGKGLPGSWVMTPGRGSTLVGQNANELSAMCVECHTANPSSRTPSPVLPFAESEALYRGSHFVRNNMDTVDRPTIRTDYERLSAWTSGAASRYGDFAGFVSVQGVVGDMICESCHNLRYNFGNNLLLETYDAGLGVSTICDGCHMDQSGGPPEHHPMTGHMVGEDADQNVAHALNINHLSHVRNPPLDATKTLDVQFFTDASAPKAMTCLSCHKAHDAMTYTGARILRRGLSMSSDVAVTNKPINVVYADNVPDAGVLKGSVITRKPGSVAIVTGLHRQSDMDAGKRLVVNMDPLCSSCH